ncbi:MAG: hypothetical protein HY259_12345 [Chloroflexi bacterium]|nr:hypothetical protein [Chloroflexota bacterium]MBI3734226.1 hypothetical protein [Chloroflexota bacterium]
MTQSLSWFNWWRRETSAEAALRKEARAARDTRERDRQMEAALNRRHMELDRTRWRTDLRPEPNI